MGAVEGRVALVTGAARGQGRAHAVALAREGADLIVTDVCADISTVPYALGTAEELSETVALVEATGRRCLSIAGRSIFVWRTPGSLATENFTNSMTTPGTT